MFLKILEELNMKKVWDANMIKKNEYNVIL